MDATNLIIHLAALAAFVFLALALLRARARERFVLSLCSAQHRLLLSSPDTLLRNFARAFAIPLTFTPASARLQPVALQAAGLVKFHWTHGISTMALTFQGNRAVLALSSPDPAGASTAWQNRLSEELKLTVTIATVAHRNKETV